MLALAAVCTGEAVRQDVWMTAEWAAVAVAGIALGVASLSAWYARSSVDAARDAADAADRAATAAEEANQLEREARARSAAAELRRQAEHVSVSQPGLATGTGVVGSYRTQAYAVRVANNSEMIVRDLEVVWKLELRNPPTHAPDPAWVAGWNQNQQHGRLLASEEHRFEFAATLPADQNAALPHTSTAEAWFTDANGVRWHIGPDHLLNEAGPR